MNIYIYIYTVSYVKKSIRKKSEQASNKPPPQRRWSRTNDRTKHLRIVQRLFKACATASYKARTKPLRSTSAFALSRTKLVQTSVQSTSATDSLVQEVRRVHFVQCSYTRSYKRSYKRAYKRAYKAPPQRIRLVQGRRTSSSYKVLVQARTKPSYNARTKPVQPRTMILHNI